MLKEAAANASHESPYGRETVYRGALLADSAARLKKKNASQIFARVKFTGKVTSFCYTKPIGTEGAYNVVPAQTGPVQC